jgi:tetratricopeptide (TPR) repeat protein
MLLNKTYERPVFPDVLEEAQALLAINRSLEARERLEQAIEANNGDDEAEGKLLLLLGGMLWEQGFAEAAEAHLNWAEALLQPFSPHVAAAAGLMELSILLDHAPDRVEERTQRLLLLGQQLGCPYLVAAAAIARATGVASVEPLLQAASWLREQQAGAALNLLKACWAELKTGGSA